MDKLKYFESEKLKCQKFIDNIFRIIEQLDYKIEELKRSKIKTDSIINKFNIDCYNYNLVDNMVKSRNRLYSRILEIYRIENAIVYDSNNLDFKIKHIGYLNDLLYKSFIELKEINKQDFTLIEKLQMNSIKKEIYDKFMLTKASIDRAKIKKSFDKIQNKAFILKAIDIFFEREYIVDMKKENLFFAIHEIDASVDQIRKNKIPKKEYKIVEILAEIEIFLRENERERKYKEELRIIKNLRENITETFSIDRYSLKAEIKKMQKSKLPIKIDKRMNRTLKEKQKMITFLTKNGYYEKNIDISIKSNLENLINKIDIVSHSLEKRKSER